MSTATQPPLQAGIEAAAGAGNDTKSPAAPPSYQAPTGAAPGYIADPEAGKTTGAYTDSTAYPAKPSPAAYPGAGDGEQPGRKRKAHRGIRGKSMLVIGMLFEPALRHAHSLAAVTIWGVTLLIIG